MSRWPQEGLSFNRYDLMIKTAFHNRWWDARKLIRVNADGTKTLVDRNAEDDDLPENEFALIQHNFSLFFGLPSSSTRQRSSPMIRLGIAFVVSTPRRPTRPLNPWTNETPEHISRLALFGAHLFNDRTRTPPATIRCSNCHESHELTDASVRRVALAPNGPVRNRDGNVIDKGFNNIGVRPTDNDLGVGATDAFRPLLVLAPALSWRRSDRPNVRWRRRGDARALGWRARSKSHRCRNVALTAPYFHNGDVLTLRQVVELYSRGGNVFPVNELDGTVIEPLGVPAPTLSSDEIDALVALPGDAHRRPGRLSTRAVRSSAALRA